jgi:hypothetical protein
VSSPQVHQKLLFLKKIALGENCKTKIENMLSARTLWKARRLHIYCLQAQYEKYYGKGIVCQKIKHYKKELGQKKKASIFKNCMYKKV